MSDHELKEKLVGALLDEFGDSILEAKIDYGMPVFRVARDKYHEIAGWLKEVDVWEFRHLVDITAVDLLNDKSHGPDRFDVVLHIRSHKHNLKIRLKTAVDGKKPVIPTLVDLFAGVYWPEREIYDMFGIRFEGHPRMTRLLNPDDFEGHPLRKDFPVKGRHRGSFPRGTVISNKRREPVIAKETHPKPLDQLLPRTPWEKKHAPLREEGEDA